MTIETVSSARSFGGTQMVCKHASSETGTDMRFAVYLPPAAEVGPVPVVWFLAGLTCTEENFTTKAGAQRVAAKYGIALVAPDTSPRGEGVPDDPEGAYDFGLGAGFYVDATVEPFARNYRMASYIESELPKVLGEALPVDLSRQGIMGHSMGGHGALTIALRNPDRFQAVSAFAPIVSPISCPWGQKALPGYLGDDRAAWREYDAVALIEDGARVPDLLVDQGTADGFLADQLKTYLLSDVCEKAGQPAAIRMQEGYDHSYYFISTFMAEHVAWHAERLK